MGAVAASNLLFRLARCLSLQFCVHCERLDVAHLLAAALDRPATADPNAARDTLDVELQHAVRVQAAPEQPELEEPRQLANQVRQVERPVRPAIPPGLEVGSRVKKRSCRQVVEVRRSLATGQLV